MEKIGMFDAKTHLPEIIRRVESGEEICLTKHNREIAFIIPVDQYYAIKQKPFMESLKDLKKRIPLGSVSDILAMRDEGRR